MYSALGMPSFDSSLPHCPADFCCWWSVDCCSSSSMTARIRCSRNRSARYSSTLLFGTLDVHMHQGTLLTMPLSSNYGRQKLASYLQTWAATGAYCNSSGQHHLYAPRHPLCRCTSCGCCGDREFMALMQQ